MAFLLFPICERPEAKPLEYPASRVLYIIIPCMSGFGTFDILSNSSFQKPDGARL